MTGLGWTRDAIAAVVLSCGASSCLTPNTSGLGSSSGPPQLGDSSTASSGNVDESAGTTSSTSNTSADTSADSTADPQPPPLPAHFGVTADWLAGTLSVIDLDALAEGAQTRDELVTRTIDLSMYSPGPLQVEVAPDRTTAVVSISPGFYGGFVGDLIGVDDVEQAGALLLVDLETEQITEVETTHVPMGIAISPDDDLAYTANYGLEGAVGTTLSVIDLDSGIEVEAIEVGERPEQVSIHPNGALGILNVVGLGAVRVFQTSNPAATLSEAVVVGSDPSDVDFIDGTPYAIVANSLDPANYVLLDVSDPFLPVELDAGPPPSGAFYAATPIPGTTDVMLTASDFTSFYVYRVSVDDRATLTELTQTAYSLPSFPLGVAVDIPGNQVLVPAPGAGANHLVVESLIPDEPVIIPWQDEIGPTYVAVAP